MFFVLTWLVLPSQAQVLKAISFFKRTKELNAILTKMRQWAGFNLSIRKGKEVILLISHSASSQKAQYWYGSSAAGLKELCLAVLSPPPLFFVFHISLEMLHIILKSFLGSYFCLILSSL